MDYYTESEGDLTRHQGYFERHNLTAAVADLTGPRREFVCGLAERGCVPNGFDLIVLGAAAMRDASFSFAGHERNPNHDQKTHALVIAEFQYAAEIKAFAEKGGVFTDQCDLEGRDAEALLKTRLEHPKSDKEAVALRDALAAYRETVARQGGLVHIDEPKPRRPSHFNVLDVRARTARP